MREKEKIKKDTGREKNVLETRSGLMFPVLSNFDFRENRKFSPIGAKRSNLLILFSFLPARKFRVSWKLDLVHTRVFGRARVAGRLFFPPTLPSMRVARTCTLVTKIYSCSQSTILLLYSTAAKILSAFILYIRQDSGEILPRV